jgi:tetratricopeptide (TPR) repeat protein
MLHLKNARTLFCLLSCVAILARASAQPHPELTKVQQALEYERQGAYPEAEKIWEQITIEDPHDSDAWAHLGLVRALEGKNSDAIVAYHEAIQLHSHLPGLQIDLALALFKQQRFKDAVPVLQTAIVESPNDLKPKLLLAMSYYGLGQYAEAVPYLTVAVNSSPENLQLRMTLAQSCLWAENYRCTLDQFQEILRLSPESAQADMLAGEALDGLNQTEEAIKQFREAEKVSPHEPEVHFGLGYLLWKNHSFDEAETELKLEIEDNPNHTQALTYLADIAIKQNDDKAARSYLQRAFQQSKVIRLGYLDLGILNAAAGNNEEAEVNFLHAIEMDPTQKDAHWRLGRLYRSMGHQKEAQAEFAKMSVLEQKDRDKVAKQMAPTSR